MRKVRLLVVLVGFFLGLCANTNCGPQERNHETKPVCKAGEITLCETGLAGDCSLGVRTCKGGQFTACQQTVTPEAESCDGRDNDCNGLVDGQCSLDLNSMPEYDGVYYYYEYCYYPSQKEMTIKVDGHGWHSGISENPIPEQQSGFITFDLSKFNGNWDSIKDVALRVYVNFLPYLDPPVALDYPPTAIKVRLWEFSNDYTSLKNCDIKGTCAYGVDEIGNPIYYPPGCVFPEINSSAVLFELLPEGNGWYSLTSNKNSQILWQLLEGHAGQKITFWLDYDNNWWNYIMDETPQYDWRLDQTILAPPTLTIEYAE